MGTATHTTKSAPDWNLVHFDVGCARCGQDLRGLTEPKCPACALEFDWSVAVPLEELTCQTCGYHLYGLSETRCPECGEAFTWNDALTAYHRSRSPFFEYQYRKHPFRAFARAFWDSIHPRRLWSTMSLHDPPRVGALLILWTVCAALTVGLPAALGVAYQRSISVLQANLRGYARFFGSWRGQPFGANDVAFMLLTLTAWIAVTFLTLASMHWSLKACRVRRSHVLRACVYLTPFVMPIPTIVYTGMFLCDLLAILTHSEYLWRRDTDMGFGALTILAPLAILVFSIVHLGYAYKRYIRMNHAWGVAVAAGIAGFLAALTVSSWRGLIRLI